MEIRANQLAVPPQIVDGLLKIKSVDDNYVVINGQVYPKWFFVQTLGDNDALISYGDRAFAVMLNRVCIDGVVPNSQAALINSLNSVVGANLNVGVGGGGPAADPMTLPVSTQQRAAIDAVAEAQTAALNDQATAQNNALNNRIVQTTNDFTEQLGNLGNWVDDQFIAQTFIKGSVGTALDGEFSQIGVNVGIVQFKGTPDERILIQGSGFNIIKKASDSFAAGQTLKWSVADKWLANVGDFDACIATVPTPAGSASVNIALLGCGGGAKNSVLSSILDVAKSANAGNGIVSVGDFSSLVVANDWAPAIRAAVAVWLSAPFDSRFNRQLGKLVFPSIPGGMRIASEIVVTPDSNVIGGEIVFDGHIRMDTPSRAMLFQPNGSHGWNGLTLRNFRSHNGGLRITSVNNSNSNIFGLRIIEPHIFMEDGAVECFLGSGVFEMCVENGFMISESKTHACFRLRQSDVGDAVVSSIVVSNLTTRGGSHGLQKDEEYCDISIIGGTFLFAEKEGVKVSSNMALISGVHVEDNCMGNTGEDAGISVVGAGKINAVFGVGQAPTGTKQKYSLRTYGSFEISQIGHNTDVPGAKEVFCDGDGTTMVTTMSGVPRYDTTYGRRGMRDLTGGTVAPVRVYPSPASLEVVNNDNLTSGSFVVAGSDVTLVEISRSSGVWTSVGSGQGSYPVAPWDQIRVTYTGTIALSYVPL